MWVFYFALMIVIVSAVVNGAFMMTGSTLEDLPSRGLRRAAIAATIPAVVALVIIAALCEWVCEQRRVIRDISVELKTHWDDTLPDLRAAWRK